jgi:choline kinase
MSPDATHVTILAAGRGTRLGEAGETTPKWLLDLDGMTVADWHLRAIGAARRSLPEAVVAVHVVTGHAAHAVRRYAHQRREHGIHIIHNAAYERLNNWYSVLVALRAIPARDSRVVVINGDLFVPQGWMARFLVDAATTTAEALVAVDLERPLTDESMKVSTRAADGADTATLGAIGKIGVTDPVGEYIGMLMASGSVLSDFRRRLEGFVGVPDAADAWYERAMGHSAQAGNEWRLWATPDSGWVEIDDAADRQKALALLPQE